MASVFLSPSLQEFNPYVGEGDEEEYMNRIADAMEPYLAASGIDFGRNSTDQTLAQAIDLSNAGDYDLHLAIHSNAAGPALAGQMRGVDVYYRPGDADSLRAAEQIAADYREIYPDPNAIQILPGLMLAELEGTRAPAVLVETAYHDNTEDAQWIRENVDTIARSLSRSVAAYLGVPFVEPAGVQPREEGPPTEAEGIPDTVPAMALRGSGQPYAVRSGRGEVYLRREPGIDSRPIGLVPDGETVLVLGCEKGWAAVRHGKKEGYMDARRLFRV